MTKEYTNTWRWEQPAGLPAKQRQFGSTTTSWRGLKQAVLSLDVICPHKSTGMHYKNQPLWSVKYGLYSAWNNAQLWEEQKRCQNHKNEYEVEHLTGSDMHCWLSWIEAKFARCCCNLYPLWLSQTNALLSTGRCPAPICRFVTLPLSVRSLITMPPVLKATD